MPWLQLKFDSPPEQIDDASNLLSELGAAAVTFEDAADQPLFEPDPGETRLWNNTRIIGLFDANIDMPDIIAQLKQALGERAPQHVQVNPLEDKDWVRAWMDTFKPIRFGQNLWICPSWHTPDEPNAVNVMLDPGLAFGTGTHPTTALCMKWLDAHPPIDMNVIDFGCGSGILAIAAALLGASHVEAVDHDPQAILATNDNAEKNSVSDKINALLPRQFEDKPADLILANILTNPLLELGPRFAKLLKPGGQIVLSGILAEQSEQVLQCYEEWFELQTPTQQDNWVRIDGVRR